MELSSVGVRLRLARESAGVSLGTMARRTNYGKGFLGNVETGQRTASPQVVAAYERALTEDAGARKLLTGLTNSVLTPRAVSQLLVSGFAAALEDHVSTDEWEHRVETIDLDYMRLGPADLQNQLAYHLVVVQQRLEDPHIWSLAARMLVAYGKTTTDRVEAVKWYRLAAAAADKGDDVATQVWVRGRAAKALAYEGTGIATAHKLATEALELSDRPTLGRLNAMVANAHVAALGGGAATALSLLEDSRHLFASVGSHEQLSDSAVPEWRFHVYSSLLLSRLGHPRAIDEQDQAEKLLPSSLPRFRTHVELHRALMLAKSGDGAGGVQYARDALQDLPERQRSLSLSKMVGEVEDASGRAPEVSRSPVRQWPSAIGTT